MLLFIESALVGIKNLPIQSLGAVASTVTGETTSPHFQIYAVQL